MDAQMDLESLFQAVTTCGRAKPPVLVHESAQVGTKVPPIEADNVTRNPCQAANGRVDAAAPSIDPMQDIVAERCPVVTLEAATQQFSCKKFTRPQSAHGNLSEGFIFEKAQPMNANMTRSFGSTAIIDLKPASGHGVVASDKRIRATVSGPTEGPAAEIARPSELCQPPCSPDQSKEKEKEPSHQPQTNQALGCSRDCPQQETEDTQPVSVSSSPREATEQIMDLDKDPKQNALPPEKNSIQTATDKETVSVRTPTGSEPHHDMRRPMRPSKPITPIAPRPRLGAKRKVSKSQHKVSKPSTSTIDVPNGIQNSQSSLADEELLAVLLSRYRTDKQTRDQERAAHVTEVQDLKDIGNSIWEQLQASLAREQLQCDELSRLRSNQPKLLEKFKNLSKYVEGLNRDHHALRDKARTIQDEQAKLQQEKGCLFADVHGIRQHSQAALVDCKSALKEAQHELHVQRHTITTQQAQMQESARSLSLERDRNDLILAEIQKIGIGHQNSAEASAAQGNHFIAKLDSTLSMLEDLRQNEGSASYEELKAIMCQCTATVNMLRDPGNVTTEDIRLLETSIRASADGITDAVQSCRDEVHSLNIDPQDLVNKVKKDFQLLRENIKSEQSLSGQIKEHCMSKAVLEERVKTSDAALLEARQRIATAQDMEASLKQKVNALEMEAVTLRKQP
ncbi:MAG: hypothetical protein Q9191_008146, partial [Dirinaria sp. TL-2023a]